MCQITASENSPLLIERKEHGQNNERDDVSFSWSKLSSLRLLLWSLPLIVLLILSQVATPNTWKFLPKINNNENSPQEEATTIATTKATREDDDATFSTSAFPDHLYPNNNDDNNAPPPHPPCIPRRLHLSQESNVQYDKDAPIVNFTLSFTVSSISKECHKKNIQPYLIYGRKTNASSNNNNNDTIDGIVTESEIVHFKYVSTPNNREKYSSDWIYHMIIPNLQGGRIQYWYKLVIVKNQTVAAAVLTPSHSNNKNSTTKSTDRSKLESLLLSSGAFASSSSSFSSSSTTSSLRATTSRHTDDDVASRNNLNIVGETASYTFITAPDLGQPTTIALVGDLGQTHYSTKTMHHIYQATAAAAATISATNGTSDSTAIAATNTTNDNTKVLPPRPPVSALLIAGDMSYADGDPHRWESWFELMEPLLRSTPTQVAAGNHEIECDNSTAEIFVPYENYFRNPNRIRPPDMWPVSDDYRKTLWNQQCTESSVFVGHYNFGNSFYSFIHGLAHVIVLNSYTDVLPGSVQYEWLDKELSQRVNRHGTPWLLVMYHCPLHTTFVGHNDELNSFLMLKSMEPLFVQYNVNFLISGHDHAYMRTKPMIGEYSSENGTGPIHLTLGAGGNREGHSKRYIHDIPEEWIARRDHQEYGYGNLFLANRTHAHFHWERDGTTEDGAHDSVWIENYIYNSS